MEQLVVDRIDLVFLDQHARVAAVELQADERVHARLGMQNPEQHLRIDRNLDRLALLGAVHDGGNTAARAQPPRLVLAASFTFLCL